MSVLFVSYTVDFGLRCVSSRFGVLNVIDFLFYFISVIQFIDIKLDIHMLIILCYWEVIPSNYKLDLRCKAGFFPKNKKGKIQSRQIENLLQCKHKHEVSLCVFVLFLC